MGEQSQWVIPDVCDHLPPKPCGSGKIKKMSIYILHPRGKFNISGQDVANAQGDACYICSDFGMAESEGYALATMWELSVFESYGQYANCNYYDPPLCIGGDDFYVGGGAPMQ